MILEQSGQEGLLALISASAAQCVSGYEDRLLLSLPNPSHAWLSHL